MPPYTRTQSRLDENETDNNSIIYSGRKLFKINGSYYYISTGENSTVKGMAFPFYGIKNNGWLIKPSGQTNFFALRKLTEDFFKNMYGKEKVYIEQWNLLSRFSYTQQMYISYKVGHDFWESEIGLFLSKYLNFDQKMYKSINIPEKGIVIDDVESVKKWLKNS